MSITYTTSWRDDDGGYTFIELADCNGEVWVLSIRRAWR